MMLPTYVVALDAIARITSMALPYVPIDGMIGAVPVAICMFVTLWAAWYRAVKT
jgi:hypothetical protein